MRYSIENDILKATIDDHGAELKSVINKNTNEEYMWCADPKFWGRTSPVLFPFVGDVRDGKYSFEGKEYKMSSHGFARDSEFELISSEEKSVWFRLKDNDESYVNYPFHFILEVGYELDGNDLKVLWRVKNPGQDRDNQTLYFSIGAHPAFNCPFPAEDTGRNDGYCMTFGDVESFVHHGNLSGTCTRERIVQELVDNKLVIDENTFGRSTYIVEDKQLSEVGIEDREGRKFVTVFFDTPLVGIWSPIGKHAPFICIEPWCGRADYDDYEGDLTQREYGNALGKDECFENVYTIKFD